MWNGEIDLFRNLMGTGLIIIWYFLSLVYLFVLEKRRELRIIFIYVPVILLLLYFNPLFAQLMYSVIGDEIYYRILWLLPMTVVISYVCVSIYSRLSGLRKELFALVAVGLIMVSGSFIYNSPLFSKAENMYHVPASVVEICDAIQVPGREVLAVFPAELLQFVRQYSPTTCMPYGREATVERWVGYGDHEELFEEMERPHEVNIDKLAPLSRDAGCHYVVISKRKKIVGDMASWDWELFFETEEYAVYRDLYIPLVIPEGYGE